MSIRARSGAVEGVTWEDRGIASGRETRLREAAVTARPAAIGIRSNSVSLTRWIDTCQAFSPVWLLLPALSSAGEAEPRGPKLEVESYRLPNGLKVALHRDSSVPRVTVCVAYHVGSKNERAGRTGFAHFFEHMMFRGTKNVPNYDIPLQETGAAVQRLHVRGHDGLFRDGRRASISSGPSTSRPSGWRSCPPRSTRRSSTPSARWSRTSGGRAYDNVPYGLVEETLAGERLPQGASRTPGR